MTIHPRPPAQVSRPNDVWLYLQIIIDTNNDVVSKANRYVSGYKDFSQQIRRWFPVPLPSLCICVAFTMQRSEICLLNSKQEGPFLKMWTSRIFKTGIVMETPQYLLKMTQGLLVAVLTHLAQFLAPSLSEMDLNRRLCYITISCFSSTFVLCPKINQCGTSWGFFHKK